MATESVVQPEVGLGEVTQESMAFPCAIKGSIHDFAAVDRFAIAVGHERWRSYRTAARGNGYQNGSGATLLQHGIQVTSGVEFRDLRVGGFDVYKFT